MIRSIISLNSVSIFITEFELIVCTLIICLIIFLLLFQLKVAPLPFILPDFSLYLSI